MKIAQYASNGLHRLSELLLAGHGRLRGRAAGGADEADGTGLLISAAPKEMKCRVED